MAYQQNKKPPVNPGVPDLMYQQLQPEDGGGVYGFQDAEIYKIARAVKRDVPACKSEIIAAAKSKIPKKIRMTARVRGIFRRSKKSTKKSNPEEMIIAAKSASKICRPRYKKTANIKKIKIRQRLPQDISMILFSIPHYNAPGCLLLQGFLTHTSNGRGSPRGAI